MTPASPRRSFPRSLWLHFRRAYAWDLQGIEITENERAKLVAAGVTAEAVQRYAVWRRSVLAVVLVPTLLAALLATADTLSEGTDGLSLVGRILKVTETLVVWGLPVSALLAMRSWATLRRSHDMVFVGWTASFLPPFFLALIPLGWWFAGTQSPEQKRELALLDVANGLYVAFTLLPTALAILPGLVRACLRVKRLFPAALLPGWFLVVAPPFYLLLAVVALIALNHLAGSPLLILGVICWIGAPMIYVWRADLFVRPLQAVDCGKVNRVQRTANVVALLGALLLAAYLFTKEVFGLHLVGLEAETSAVWLWENHEELALQPGQILKQAESIFWLGDISLSQVLVEYCGRSLFMTAVFADLLVRMSLSVWGQEKGFAGSADAAVYEETMASLHHALGPKTDPRSQAPPGNEDENSAG